MVSLQHLQLMDIAFVITREHTESAAICFMIKANLLDSGFEPWGNSSIDRPTPRSKIHISSRHVEQNL